MLEMKVRVGPEAFSGGSFVYVWMDQGRRPIYVGETGKSVSDRIGLHIRGKERSGAILSKIIHERNMPEQEYIVLAFPIDTPLLEKIAKENGAAANSASFNRARKALERRVYDLLSEHYDNLHQARGCRWRAESGAQFAGDVLEACRSRTQGT